MAIHIEWGDERKWYVYSRFHDGWTWADNIETRAIYVKMMQTVSHRVDAVADFTDVSVLPTGLFSNVRRIVDTRQANEGYFIMFGVNSFVRTMYAVTTRVVPQIKKQFIIVETMEDALKIVESERSEKDYSK